MVDLMTEVFRAATWTVTVVITLGLLLIIAYAIEVVVEWR